MGTPRKPLIAIASGSDVNSDVCCNLLAVAYVERQSSCNSDCVKLVCRHRDPSCVADYFQVFTESSTDFTGKRSMLTRGSTITIH